MSKLLTSMEHRASTEIKNTDGYRTAPHSTAWDQIPALLIFSCVTLTDCSTSLCISDFEYQMELRIGPVTRGYV